MLRSFPAQIRHAGLLLLHSDVTGHHAVDSLRHLPVIALDFLNRNADVDIAAIMLADMRFISAINSSDWIELLNGVVEAYFLAQELLQLRFEIAFAELSNAGHRFLLYRDVPGHHPIDSLCHF